jgi:chromosome segregation ATPase
MENSGIYRCFAKNSKGSGSSNVSIVVTKSPKIFIPSEIAKYIDYKVKCTENDTSIELYPNDKNFINNTEKCIEEILVLKSENEKYKEALNSSLALISDSNLKLDEATAKNEEISEKLKNMEKELFCCNKNVSLLEKQFKTCEKNLNDEKSKCSKEKCCKDEGDSNESSEKPKKKPCKDKDSDASKETDGKKSKSKIFEFLFKFNDQSK